MSAEIDDPEYFELLHLLMEAVEWKKMTMNKQKELFECQRAHVRDFEKQVDLIFNKYHGKKSN